MRGQVMLAAVDTPDGLTASARALARIEPAPGGGPLEFDCAMAAGKVRMRPFYRIQRESYSTFFRRANA